MKNKKKKTRRSASVRDKPCCYREGLARDRSLFAFGFGALRCFAVASPLLLCCFALACLTLVELARFANTSCFGAGSRTRRLWKVGQNTFEKEASTMGIWRFSLRLAFFCPLSSRTLTLQTLPSYLVSSALGRAGGRESSGRRGSGREGRRRKGGERKEGKVWKGMEGGWCAV